MYNKLNIENKIIDFVNKNEKELESDFKKIDEIYEYNQLKVLKSFIDNKVSDNHFIESTGYGYNDTGRDVVESVYKNIFASEDALVRQQIVSGTHAISILLYAVCRPGDKILSINGLPYDTLHSVIGINENKSSLKAYGVDFDYVDLEGSDFDYNAIKSKITDKTKIIMIQRSRGYSDRYPLGIDKIKKVTEFIKSINKETIIFVDNCYCEFVDKVEPTEFGVDAICGSLIKNPGGGLAKTGAYIAGNRDIVELCAERLTSPGIGKEVGVNFNQNRNILQGLYLAPQIVSNALKIAKLYAKVLNELNIETIPRCDEKQDDIVLAIKFNDENKLKQFCNIIQSTSPVDSYIKPYSADMPGYDSEVIMAAGCFVSGASIELSCDAPIRPPYMAFMQGGLTYYQGKYSLMKAVKELDLI